LLVDYNHLVIVGESGTSITQIEYIISNGNYSLTQIIDELNTQHLYNNGIDPPYPEFQFSYSSSINKVIITNLRTTNGDGDIYDSIGVGATGLAKLLGINFSVFQYFAGNFGPANSLTYTFPKAPVINSKYLALNSNLFNIIRETRTIKPISTSFDDAYISNTLDDPTEIFLSRKTDIETFDIFLTNDRDEIISLREDNMMIIMTFTVS